MADEVEGLDSVLCVPLCFVDGSTGNDVAEIGLSSGGNNVVMKVEFETDGISLVNAVGESEPFVVTPAPIWPVDPSADPFP